MQRLTRWALCLTVAFAGACGGDDPTDPEGAAGKADWFGNRERDVECSYDWQCSVDHWLICRPAIDWRSLSVTGACQGRGRPGEPCWLDDDCIKGICDQHPGHLHGRCQVRCDPVMGAGLAAFEACVSEHNNIDNLPGIQAP